MSGMGEGRKSWDKAVAERKIVGSQEQRFLQPGKVTLDMEAPSQKSPRAIWAATDISDGDSSPACLRTDPINVENC